MAISKEALANIINHNSSTLCSRQGDKMLNEYKSGKGSMEDVDPNSYHDQWDDFSLSDDSQPFEEGKPMPSMQYTNESVSRSRMDDKIKQSMMNKRIDSGSMGDTAFLAEMASKKPKRQQMTESRQAPAPAASIDYSIIKAIVNECLSEYFSKNQINESKGGSQSIAYSDKTNKIRIIKENGDVYGGKLTFQGNVNDKEK